MGDGPWTREFCCPFSDVWKDKGSTDRKRYYAPRSQPAILNLLELRMRCPEIFTKLEVYVDGGFERGTDILKAIALGATAVGIGRPYLYSLVYGQEGAEHLTQSE